MSSPGNPTARTVHIQRHTQHARKMRFNVSAAPGMAQIGLQGVMG